MIKIRIPQITDQIHPIIAHDVINCNIQIQKLIFKKWVLKKLIKIVPTPGRIKFKIGRIKFKIKIIILINIFEIHGNVIIALKKSLSKFSNVIIFL